MAASIEDIRRGILSPRILKETMGSH